MLASVLACHVHRDDAATTVTGAGHRADPVESLANALDDRRVRPLADDMPAWLEDALGVRAHVETDVENLGPTEMLALHWYSTDAQADAGAERLFALLRTIVSRERALEQLDDAESFATMYTLYFMYSALDVPPKGEDLDAVADASVDAWMTRGSATEAAEARRFVRGALRRAQSLRRHVLARMLRIAGDDPRLVQPLVRESVRVEAGNGSALKIELARHAIRCAGEDADAPVWIGLAMACFSGLDLRCGDEAMAQAGRAPLGSEPGTSALLAALPRMQTRARRALEIGDAKGLDERIERARLLLDLGRIGDAGAAFAAIGREHPNDARAIVGAVDVLLRRERKVELTAALLDRDVQRLEHVDAEVHAFLLALRIERVHLALVHGTADAHFAIAQLERLLVDARALETLGDGRGAAARLVGERMLEALQTGDDAAITTATRTMLPAAMELQSRYPDSGEVYRVMLTATALSPDADAAFRALALPLPEGDVDHEALERARMRARFDAMVLWNRFDGLHDMLTRSRELLKTITGSPLDHLRLMFDMLRVLAGESRIRWSDVAHIERTALEQIGVEDGMLDNAVGVALVESGEREQGIEWLERAIEVAHGRDRFAEELAVLNLVALEAHPVSRAEELLASQQLDVRVLALALLVRRSRGAARAQWRRDLAGARAQQCAQPFWGAPLSVTSGVLLPARLQLDLAWFDNRLEYQAGPPPVRGQLVDAATDLLAATPCSRPSRARRPTP